MLQVYARNARSGSRGLARVGSLVLSLLGAVTTLPSQGQEPIPSVGSQAAAPSLSEQFSKDLEILSKRLGVALVAEGEPFPQIASGRVPSLDETLPPDEAVKEVANYFDYTAVRQGKVYLLTKRYTNPDDMPDVTPEECRYALKILMTVIPTGRTPANAPNTMESDLIYDFTSRVNPMTKLIPWERLKTGGVRVGELHDALLIWGSAYKYYLLTQHDLVEGALEELDNRPPLNPYFHWKTIEKARVFGYDNFQADFVPLSDFQRIVVSPRKDSLIKPGYLIRNDVTLPEQDPTDPAGLSEQTKRFLDRQGNSSRAVSLAQAVATLNKRTAKSDAYRVDDMYASKHVTLAGIDKLSPIEAMQAMAAVYSLRVAQRTDGRIVPSVPAVFIPNATPETFKTMSMDANAATHALDRMIFSALPAPIYRAVRARVAPGQAGHLENVPEGASKDANPALTLEQFDTLGAKLQNSAVRIFRYLAEPQVQAQPARQLLLSHIAERARNLFAFARTAPAFVAACGLVDCLPPPYFTDFNDFCVHTTLWGDIQGDLFSGERLRFTLRYDNPATGKSYGPLRFFDALAPNGIQTHIFANGIFPPRLSPDPY